MPTEPSHLQLEAFRSADQTRPINMVNLLKFRDIAEYSEAESECAENLSGRDAYGRYAKVA